jgi:hypothetical protein
VISTPRPAQGAATAATGPASTPAPGQAPSPTDATSFDGVREGAVDRPLETSRQAGNLQARLRAPTKKSALGPDVPPSRAAGVVADKTDQHGRAVQLLDTGGALVDGARYRPGVALSAVGEHLRLTDVAPLLSEDGRPFAVRRDGDRVRLEPLADGPVDGAPGLSVRDGAFVVAASGGRVLDADGQLTGFDDGVTLRGTRSRIRRLERSLRDSVLRAVSCGDGQVRRVNLDGFLVQPDGLILDQRQAGPPALYADDEGNAFEVETTRQTGVAVDLVVRPAADGPVGDKAIVRGGRLLQLDDACPGVGLTSSGEPAALLDDDTSGWDGRLISGRGGYGEWLVAVDEGAVSFVQVRARHGEEMLLVDGERASIRGRDGAERAGAFGDGPSHIVHDGRALEVVAQARRALLARGPDGLVAFTRDDPPAPLAAERAPLFTRTRGDRLDELVVAGERYAVACEPVTRAHLADGLLGALDVLRLQPDADFLSRSQRNVLERLQPLSADKEDRATLRAEVEAGGGPALQAALGADAMALVEAITGALPSGDDPFVYGLRGAGSRVRRRGAGFQAPGDAAHIGVFRATRAGLRPATIEEVARHFDQAVGDAPARPLASAPRADDVSLGAEGISVRAGDETFTIPIDARPDDERLPTTEDIVGWLEHLPLQTLRSLERVAFHPPDPNGQARFDIASGTLFYNAVSADFWRDADGGSITAHEVVGHGLEAADPLVYRLLMEARLLDGIEGEWFGTDDAYGDTNLAESFAVGVQELLADGDAATRRPHFARLVSALLTEDGQPRDPLAVHAMLRRARL